MSMLDFLKKLVVKNQPAQPVEAEQKYSREQVEQLCFEEKQKWLQSLDIECLFVEPSEKGFLQRYGVMIAIAGNWLLLIILLFKR